MQAIPLALKPVDDGQTIQVLIADDEPTIVYLLCRWLTADGFVCTGVSDGRAALERLRHGTYDLLISDMMMPGMTGMELLTEAVKLDPTLAVIIVTAVTERATAMQALRLGAYGYIIKPFERDEVLIAVASALERRRLLAISREYELELESKVRERTLEIRRREAEITMHLVAAAEYRDEETGTHIRRIGRYAEVMAQALGWPADAIGNLCLAAPMHDIGKIGIPDHILQKPGKLEPDEYQIMKTHTDIGAAILGNTDIPLMEMGQDIAIMHHERWDGSGYPRGLRGDAISASARIVTLIDMYDALMTNRVYRPAFPEEKTLSLLGEVKDTHFDPEVWTCFMDIYTEVRAIFFTEPPPNEG